MMCFIPLLGIIRQLWRQVLLLNETYTSYFNSSKTRSNIYIYIYIYIYTARFSAKSFAYYLHNTRIPVFVFYLRFSPLIKIIIISNDTLFPYETLVFWASSLKKILSSKIHEMNLSHFNIQRVLNVINTILSSSSGKDMTSTFTLRFHELITVLKQQLLLFIFFICQRNTTLDFEWTLLNRKSNLK
jgi:hypothetical protein